MKVIEVRILTSTNIHRGFKIAGGTRIWKLEEDNLDDADVSGIYEEEEYKALEQAERDRLDMCLLCFGPDLVEQEEARQAIEEAGSRRDP